MKLWIDDIRNSPDDSWHVCRTNQSAVNAIHQFSTEVTEISFDHDISHQVTVGKSSRPMPCDETFQPAAHYLGLLYKYDQSAPDGSLQWFPSVTIHSANPVGAQEIFNILNTYGLRPEILPLPQANRLELTL